jgi:protein-disulfide isomerase
MARRRRPEPQIAQPAPQQARRASPRVLIAVAVAAVLLVGIGVGIGLLLNGSSTTSAGTTEGLPQAADVRKLFDGIPQRGTALGSASAPVTMVEYVDLQCPFCQQFATLALPEVIERYVRSGRLRLELRAIDTLGADSHRGQLALVAAGQQNKLFELAHLLYLNQRTENSGWLSDALVASAAASIDGLDVSRFNADLGSTRVANEAGTFYGLAQRDRVSETPTVLVGKTGGTLTAVTLRSSSDATPVTGAVDALLG